MSKIAERPAVGELLREWRQRRRLTQLDLALSAGVSARHLSFIETGRSRPSADMVVALAAELDVPLRERNTLLLAAGFAPAYDQRELAEPGMGPIRQAIDRLLAGHEPYAPRIQNLGEWRGHFLDRLGREAVLSGDPALAALHAELAAYPGGEGTAAPSLEVAEIATPLRILVDGAELAFISTATQFGTAVEVTVSELSIESFFPADDVTVEHVKGWA